MYSSVTRPLRSIEPVTDVLVPFPLFEQLLLCSTGCFSSGSADIQTSAALGHNASPASVSGFSFSVWFSASGEAGFVSSGMHSLWSCTSVRLSSSTGPFLTCEGVSVPRFSENRTLFSVSLRADSVETHPFCSAVPSGVLTAVVLNESSDARGFVFSMPVSGLTFSASGAQRASSSSKNSCKLLSGHT